MLDEQTVTLHLTVSPALLPPTVLNLRTDRPPGITYSQDTSAFLNYALNWSDFKRVDAFGEAGLSLAGTLLASSFSRTAEGAFIRGLTSLTLDERARLRRWVLGDHFASTGMLGGGAFLGGLSVSREFTLDPYLFRYPALGLSGALLTPSTVDLYVNGVLVRQEQLPPGPFALQNLPVVSGSGSTRLVIRDAFGREQEITTPYYFSTGLLAPGLSEYSYNLGFQRQHTGSTSGDYGPLTFLGRHRLGLNETLTAGVRFEGSTKLLSGGPSVTIRPAHRRSGSGCRGQPRRRRGRCRCLPGLLVSRSRRGLQRLYPGHERPLCHYRPGPSGRPGADRGRRLRERAAGLSSQP